MAHYRVLETCYINDTLYDEGRELYLPADFAYGPHLEPLDDEANAAKSKWEKAGKIGPNDPRFTMSMVEAAEDKADGKKEPVAIVDRKGTVRGVSDS